MTDTNKHAAVLIDTDNAEVAAREYAKQLPGWAELPEKTRASIIEKTIATFGQERPVRMRSGKTDAGALDMGPIAGETPTEMALALCEAFGTPSLDLVNARLIDLLTWFHAGETRDRGVDFNAAIAHVHGSKPTTPAETMLATQMVITNNAALRALTAMDRNLSAPEHAQRLGNLANKLLRTCAAQAEALAKLQRGGEQTIKHVHIDNRGGQAVVAEQFVTGGPNEKSDDQPYGTGAASIGAALLGEDPLGNGVPIPGDAWEEALPTARRTVPRRAKR